MKIYLVGGAVRDALLGLPVKDRDWVVVGSTPQEMLDAGYQQVGRDFLCFCIRKRMKSMRWHVPNGNPVPVTPVFTCYAAPDVTLEDDLKRRDLTIMRWPRTITARLSTRTTVWAICKIVCCAMFPPLLAKIRYAYCAWRVLLRVMPTSVFVLPMKLWR